MMRKTITASMLAFALGVCAEPDHPYAAESLVGDAPYTIEGPPRATGFPRRIEIDAYTDILLPAGTYFLTFHLWDAELTRTLAAADWQFWIGASRLGSGDLDVTPVFRGEATDNSAVFMIEAFRDLPRGTNPYINLNDGDIAVPDRMPKKYMADVYIYTRLNDALAAARADTPADAPSALFQAVHGKDDNKLVLFEVANKAMAPTVTAHLATANVAASGGPFTGFEPDDETGTTEDTGVLATIVLHQDGSPFLDAADGMLFEEDVFEGVTVEVTAEPGSFGFGTGTGDRERGIDPEDEDAEPLAPTAFNIAADATDCSGGSALTLTADGRAIDPGATPDPTYARDADAGRATAAGQGPFLFCVNTAGNTTAIPAVGDENQLDGYRVTATSLMARATDTAAAVQGPRASANGGAINRNGTSVNITYLSLEESHNQRLVIVNRCACDAEYWVDSFQTEANTRIFGRIEGSVPPRSRKVIRVQDVLDYNRGTGVPRASGIINVTVSEPEVDIMTVQAFTAGGIDTTVYNTKDD